MFESGPVVASATIEGVVFQAFRSRCSPGAQSDILYGAQQSLNARHIDIIFNDFNKQTDFILTYSQSDGSEK